MWQIALLPPWTRKSGISRRCWETEVRVITGIRGIIFEEMIMLGDGSKNHNRNKRDNFRGNARRRK
jgi:hypothetical protein